VCLINGLINRVLAGGHFLHVIRSCWGRLNTSQDSRWPTICSHNVLYFVGCLTMPLHLNLRWAKGARSWMLFGRDKQESEKIRTALHFTKSRHRPNATLTHGKGLTLSSNRSDLASSFPKPCPQTCQNLFLNLGETLSPPIRGHDLASPKR
jgi:hypothetical protein